MEGVGAFEMVIALLGAAVAAVVVLGIASTRALLRALPHVRGGVARADAARAVKRPRLSTAPIDRLSAAEGLPHARRAARLTEWQGRALGVAGLLLLTAIALRVVAGTAG